MKFKKINYSTMLLSEETTVRSSYITSVQNNKFQQVSISPDECKSSVRAISKLSNKNKREN